MTFETALASCGKLIDEFINWNLSLDLPYKILLYIIYFLIISCLVLKILPPCSDGPC